MRNYVNNGTIMSAEDVVAFGICDEIRNIFVNEIL